VVEFTSRFASFARASMGPHPIPLYSMPDTFLCWAGDVFFALV
jgi:hypothetical protein